MPESGSVVGDDGQRRCSWVSTDQLYLDYHDTEWGRPVSSVQGLYERLSLEAFQSGLSWITILRKRPAFREAFAGFQPDKVAEFGEDDVARLMADTRIVRNRAKIDATISNARVIADWGQGFADLVLSYAQPDRPRPASGSEIPAVTPESIALSKALKKHGIRFFGPTTAYATMQAVGLVDDHLADCFVTIR